MSTPPLNGLYEISFGKTDGFLAFLFPHEDAAAVLLPNGFERAGQIWEVRTDKNNAITLYNLKYRLYLSFEKAAPNSPLVASAHPREWVAEKGQGTTAGEYILRVPEVPGEFHDESKFLFADEALIKIYPPETALRVAGSILVQGWKFHKLVLPSEAA